MSMSEQTSSGSLDTSPSVKRAVSHNGEKTSEGAVGNGGEVPESAARADKAGLPLSPEEQMAQFEEALKEEDWGHQPC